MHFEHLLECEAKYTPFQVIPSIEQFFLIHFMRFGQFTFVISIVFGHDIEILADSKVVNSLTKISISRPKTPL